MSKKKHSKEEPQEPRDNGPEPEPTEADETDALRTERDDYLARLQRVSADYQNYRKRVQRDIAQAQEYANESLIRELLGVLDDMERALETARQNHDDDDPLLVGMQMVHDKALTVLGHFGVEVMDPLGKPFDPQHHAAVLQQPSADHDPQTVINVGQKGYTLKGRTLRPASVVVSKEPDEEEETEEEA